MLSRVTWALLELLVIPDGIGYVGLAAAVEYVDCGQYVVASSVSVEVKLYAGGVGKCQHADTTKCWIVLRVDGVAVVHVQGVDDSLQEFDHLIDDVWPNATRGVECEHHVRAARTICNIKNVPEKVKTLKALKTWQN